MRASLEHAGVQVVAVNDPFIPLDYMVRAVFNLSRQRKRIPRRCLLKKRLATLQSHVSSNPFTEHKETEIVSFIQALFAFLFFFFSILSGFFLEQCSEYGFVFE